MAVSRQELFLVVVVLVLVLQLFLLLDGTRRCHQDATENKPSDEFPTNSPKIDSTTVKASQLQDEKKFPESETFADRMKTNSCGCKCECETPDYNTVRQDRQSPKANPHPSNCREVRQENAKVWDGKGGVFDIFIPLTRRRIEVYCDMTIDGGGWTILQRRFDGSTNFTRGFSDYVSGFGNKTREMWLGETFLRFLKAMLSQENLTRILCEQVCKISTNLQKFLRNQYTYYEIWVGMFASENDGDDLMQGKAGRKFKTWDADYNSLAKKFGAGWWYDSQDYRGELPNPNKVIFGEHEYTRRLRKYGSSSHGNYPLRAVEIKFRKKI